MMRKNSKILDNVFRPNFNLKKQEEQATNDSRTIRTPLNYDGSNLFSITMTGDKYRHLGIFDGDILIAKEVTDLSEVKGNCLCIYEDGKERYAMFSSQITDEKLLGIVIRIERDFSY